MPGRAWEEASGPGRPRSPSPKRHCLIGSALALRGVHGQSPSPVLRGAIRDVFLRMAWGRAAGLPLSSTCWPGNRSPRKERTPWGTSEGGCPQRRAPEVTGWQQNSGQVVTLAWAGVSTPRRNSARRGAQDGQEQLPNHSCHLQCTRARPGRTWSRSLPQIPAQKGQSCLGAAIKVTARKSRLTSHFCTRHSPSLPASLCFPRSVVPTLQ